MFVGFCSDEVAVEAPVIAQLHEVGLFEDASIEECLQVGAMDWDIT
jgi:hypothetical protein